VLIVIYRAFESYKGFHGLTLMINYNGSVIKCHK